jgi:hypothetical protein
VVGVGSGVEPLVIGGKGEEGVDEEQMVCDGVREEVIGRGDSPPSVVMEDGYVICLSQWWQRRGIDDWDSKSGVIFTSERERVGRFWLVGFGAEGEAKTLYIPYFNSSDYWDAIEISTQEVREPIMNELGWVWIWFKFDLNLIRIEPIRFELISSWNSSKLIMNFDRIKCQRVTSYKYFLHHSTIRFSIYFSSKTGQSTL